MKIAATSNLNLLQSRENSKHQKANTTEREKQKPAATYEKSKPEDKGFIYDRMNFIISKNSSIMKFTRQSNDRST